MWLNLENTYTHRRIGHVIRPISTNQVVTNTKQNIFTLWNLSCFAVIRSINIECYVLCAGWRGFCSNALFAGGGIIYASHTHTCPYHSRKCVETVFRIISKIWPEFECTKKNTRCQNDSTDSDALLLINLGNSPAVSATAHCFLPKSIWSEPKTKFIYYLLWKSLNDRCKIWTHSKLVIDWLCPIAK